MPTPARRLALALGLCTVGICLTWSVLVPALTGPDEDSHLDIVHEQVESGTYPLTAAYRVHAWARHAGREAYEYDRDHLHHRWLAANARARADRAAIGALTPERAGSNQLTQHPPAGWLPAVAATWVADAVSVLRRWPFDRAVLLGRWASVLPMLVLPGLLAATARRLGASPPIAIAAAITPLAVPQITYIAGMLSNDTLLLVGSALTTLLIARVVAGDTSTRTAALLGLALGGTLLTKAFAIPLAACALLAFVVAPRRRSDTPDPADASAPDPRFEWTPRLRSMGITVVVAFVGGGWWWARNLVVEGVLQPDRSAFRPRPPGFVPMDPVPWMRQFTSWLTTRTWGWFGHFASEIRLPSWLVVVATAVVGVGVVAGAVFGTAVQRRFTLLVAIAFGGAFVAIAGAARHIHVEFGANNAIQGRYLFAAMPGVLVVATIGWSHLVVRIGARRASPGWGPPIAVTVAAVVLQATAAHVVLAGYWGTRHAALTDRLRAMAAWSPAPPWLVGGVLAATLVAGAWAARLVASVARAWQADAESPSR